MSRGAEAIDMVSGSKSDQGWKLSVSLSADSAEALANGESVLIDAVDERLSLLGISEIELINRDLG